MLAALIPKDCSYNQINQAKIFLFQLENNAKTYLKVLLEFDGDDFATGIVIHNLTEVLLRTVRRRHAQ